LCRRSLSSPSARTVRDTALAALGAAAVTRTGAPTKQLDLDAERATRFCATEALRDAVRDAMMSLTTYGRSRAVARVV